jgi:hypothetical protein
VGETAYAAYRIYMAKHCDRITKVETFQKAFYEQSKNRK